MKRTYLVIVAATLALQGLVFMFAPGAYFPAAGGTEFPRSLHEALWGFGGLYLGYAGFLVLSLLRRSPIEGAILSVVIVMIGIIAGRVAGIALDGVPERRLLVATGLELAFATVGALLLLGKSGRGNHGAPHQPD